MIYEKAVIKLPWLKNIKDSFVKAEKVVKEPRKPMIKNSFVRDEPLTLLMDKKIPINKHPVIFTKKVPKGIPKKEILVRKSETRNLEIAPKPPPSPISK